MSYQKEFDELKLELDQYIRVIEGPFYNLLDRERGNYSAFLNDILFFYFFTSFISEIKIKNVEERLKPIIVLYSKSSLSLFGIFSCLQNGLISESSAILRSIFENLLNLELILKGDHFTSPYYRMKIYDEYKFVIQRRSLLANRELVKKDLLSIDKFNHQFNPELIRRTEKEYDRVRSNYNDGKAKHWAWDIFRLELKNRDPNIKFICHKLSRDYDYIKLYSSLSAQIHSTSVIQNVLIDKDIISLAPKFSPLIISIGAMAMNYCSEIVKYIINFLEPPSKRALADFNESFVTEVVLKNQ